MEHRSCRRTAYSQPLPSRVIELTETCDSQDPCGARLIETHGIMQGTYVCLSYCWGDSKPWNQIGQTTSANLSKYLETIPFHSLPKTVVDAIYLCYELGFRFLWVDRLCIVQDDKDDWKNEASKMCDIYNRSALTISVPLCVQSSESFLEKRQDPHPTDWKGSFATIDFIDKGSNSSRALCFVQGRLARGQASWFLENNWVDFARDYSVSHHGNRWITRGWTFQEWILSPRVIHIDTMTLWDCFEGYANELNRRYVKKAVIGRNPGELGRHVPWQPIVEEYSQREITNEEDRLPALDGLAAHYHHTTGYTYLVGLWLEEMPRSLLWQRNRYDEAKTPVSRTLPSWSWASLGTRAMYIFAFSPDEWVIETFISTASICRWPGSPNPVSSNEKAWIDIKGHISVVVDQHLDGPAYYDDCLLKVDNKWWRSLPDRGREYPGNELAQSKVYLIVLGSVNGTGPTHTMYGGLVLQRCGYNDDRLWYRRLGIATLVLNERPWLNAQYGPSWELQVVHLI